MSVSTAPPALSPAPATFDLAKFRGSLPPLIPSVGLAGAIALGSLVALPLAASASPQIWTVTSVASVDESVQAASAATAARASRSVARATIKKAAPKPVVLRHLVTREVAVGATESGQASWYGGNWAGRTTASGEVFRPAEMTAAHKFLPFGTRVRVCTQWSCVIVRITDRGPYVTGRIVDLSEGAAGRVGIISSGVGYVTLTPIELRTFLEPIALPKPAPHKAAPARASRSTRGEAASPVVATLAVARPAAPVDSHLPAVPALALAPVSILGAVAGLRGRARVCLDELPGGEPAVA